MEERVEVAPDFAYRIVLESPEPIDWVVAQVRSVGAIDARHLGNFEGDKAIDGRFEEAVLQE